MLYFDYFTKEKKDAIIYGILEIIEIYIAITVLEENYIVIQGILIKQINYPSSDNIPSNLVYW